MVMGGDGWLLVSSVWIVGSCTGIVLEAGAGGYRIFRWQFLSPAIGLPPKCPARCLCLSVWGVSGAEMEDRRVNRIFGVDCYGVWLPP